VITKWAGKDGSETYNTYHSATLIETTLSASEKKGSLDASTITPEWTAAPQKPTSAQPKDSKPPLTSIINLPDLLAAFEHITTPKSWAYTSSASNDLLTHHLNQSSWNRLLFRPRILRPVKRISTSTKVLGANLHMPVWICPMGIAKTAGPEGEAALGGGAADAGIVHCMASTTSSMSVAEMVDAVPKGWPYFAQVYINRDRSKTEAVLKELEGIQQVKAIFVTVDLAVVSKREADEKLTIKEALEEGGKPAGGLARSTGSFIDWEFGWEDFAWLRRHTSKPLLLKGVQSAADAVKAMAVGCAGIVVSNHGGRALDGAPGTVGVLLELRRDCPEVFDRMEVLVDGGVRRGSDVVKAILLGAKAVGVGRPFQAAVAWGREGVGYAAGSKSIVLWMMAIRIDANDQPVLQDEIETAMRLCGITDLDAARGDLSYLNYTDLLQALPPKPASRGWFGLGGKDFNSRQTKL
jgi:L-lactate dehydrogenase (cytochrome)